MTLDLAALREHVGPGPSDDVLEAQLAAALEAIDMRYGTAEFDSADESQREYLRPFGQWVRLGRRASAVTTVLESEEVVDDEHYELWQGGRYIRRLDDDETQTAWTGWVDVTYVPLSEANERDRVTIALVKHALSFEPALASITVGPWSESYSSNGDESYRAQREDILASLRPRLVGTW